MSGKGTVAKTAGGFILKYAGDYLRIPRKLTKGAQSADEVAQRIAKSGADPSRFAKAKRLREIFLGKTPGKLSKTGQDVFKRMADEGKILNARGRPVKAADYPNGISRGDLTELRVRDQNGTLRPLTQAHMGHNPKDAVDYWTETGYRRTPEQNRKWMNDPDNYEFEYGPDNMAKGRANKNRYGNADPIGGADIP